MAVKNRGGVAIVQNPDEALYSGMPKSAIENVEVDHILGISEIAPVLVELAHKPVETEQVEAVSSEMQMEYDIAEMEPSALSSTNRPGMPSGFGCPDCGGALWELDQEGLIRFRCRTGHAFSANTLLAQQSEALEEALWSAFRALEEKAALAQRIASQARDRNRIISAERFEDQEQDARQRAALVRQLLLKDNGNGELSTINGQMVGEQRSSGEGQGDKGSSPLQVVAIGTSAGGMKALTKLLSALPADFPAAITILQHLHPQHPSGLADILEASTTLKVKQAEDGDLLRPGTVYIAPLDRHLLVNSDSTLSLSHSELVHFVRPSTDLLFESVAASLKQQAIAVVLTGNGSDGAMGVRAIKEMGGTAIAQDQASCEDFVPSRAISTGSVDWVLPLSEIAATLVNIVTKKNKETQAP
jgi:two-component system chemotaxis response regulator CheB